MFSDLYFTASQWTIASRPQLTRQSHHLVPLCNRSRLARGLLQKEKTQLKPSHAAHPKKSHVERRIEHPNIRIVTPHLSIAQPTPCHFMTNKRKKKERQQKNRYPGKRPQAAVLTPYRYTPSVTTLHTSCLGLFRELLSLSLSFCVAPAGLASTVRPSQQQGARRLRGHRLGRSGEDQQEVKDGSVRKSLRKKWTSNC